MFCLDYMVAWLIMIIVCEKNKVTAQLFVKNTYAKCLRFPLDFPPL